MSDDKKFDRQIWLLWWLFVVLMLAWLGIDIALLVLKQGG